MNNSAISIIIPAYNAEKTIERTLKSILAQTFRDWELIVVNDGSKDDTLNILHEIASTDERIQIINQDNCGAYRARLSGVENSSSKWVTFIDSDDVLEPTNLQTLYDIASEAEKCDIIVGNLIFAGNTICKGEVFVHQVTGILTPIAYQRAMLEGKTTIGPYAKLYRRSLFERAKGSLNSNRFDQNEDLLMLLKLSKHCDNGVYIDPCQRVVYTYYRRLNSASSKSETPDKWFQLFTEIRKTLIDCTLNDAFITYQINTLFNNCILPGVSLVGYETEVSQLIQQLNHMSSISNREKYLIVLLKSPALCSLISKTFRFLRTLSRLTRH